MLSKQVFKDEINKLCSTFKPQVDFTDPEVMAFWYDKLKSFSDEDFEMAVNDAICHSDFFPTIAFFYRKKTERPNGW